MTQRITGLYKFFIDKKSFSINNAYYVLNPDYERVVYVDQPAFAVSKKLKFYADDMKYNTLFSVVQDQIVQPINAKFTMYDADDNPLAKFHANLMDNLAKRNVTILTPDESPICQLVEESAVGGLLGALSGANFLFLAQDDVLGKFLTGPNEEKMFTLELDPTKKLDQRVALGAAIILYARLI